MKKLLCAAAFLTSAAVLPFAVTSAENAKEDVSEAAEESPQVSVDANLWFMPGSRIAVVTKNTKGAFWEQLHAGMEDAVKEVNDTFGLSGDDKITMTYEGPGDEKEVEDQINTIDAVIAENPDVLCLCAGDMDSCQAQLEEASDNGIPVVVFDSRVADMSLVSAYRTTDNRMLGSIAGEKMSEALDGSGEIIVFSAQEKTSTSRERVEGFLDVLDDYSDIHVNEIIYDDQVEDMAAAMQEALESDPEVDAVYCANDNTSLVFLSLPHDEENPLIFIGTDASKKQQEAIRDGRELGCVSQNPYAMGYQTILTAVCLTDVDAPADIEEELLIEPKWIDADNLDDPEIKEYLYG